jgi:hypothetical protein
MSRARARPAGWVGAVLALLVGGFVLWRRQPDAPRSRASAVVDVDPAVARDSGAASRRPRTTVPKFQAPSDLGPGSDTGADDGPEAAAGNDDLGPAERAEIDRIEDAIRAEAANAVGLSVEERAKVAAIRADLDVRRRRFEAQIDPATRMLEPLASAAVLGNARAERRQIGRALGQERADALLEAERAAWARVRQASPEAGTARPGPAASRMLARRLTAVPSRPTTPTIPPVPPLPPP